MATAGVQQRFCRCACFCSENLYVARYGLHVRFRGEQQLRADYGPVSAWAPAAPRRKAREGWRRRDLVPGVAGSARGLRSDRHSGSASRCPRFLPFPGEAVVWMS